MIFNSIYYIAFLSVIAVIYYIFPGRYKWICLLIASIGYYISFIPIYSLLLIGIIVINYIFAKWLIVSSDKHSTHKFILIVILNILFLAFFKYYNNIFPENQLLLYKVNFYDHSDLTTKLILPLGLSYLIFTVISYQIEIKRRTIQPEKHFGYFSVYLLFFPKIAQGPIERPQKLIPQLRLHHSFNDILVVEGIKLMLWGYFKKLVVADRLAIYVNAVYNNNEHHNGSTLILATIFFAIQIYADFSGYTDIALGSAKIFGFNLSDNFKRPYFSKSLQDFWNRWHITFSNWLRDYIFLPLAYSLSHNMKKQKYLFISTDKWIYMVAILITFIICGIWHGVGWTYLIWGLIFGIGLTYSNWTKKFHNGLRKKLHISKTSHYYDFYKILTTFLVVIFAWIFFRADSLNDSFRIIRKIFTSFFEPLYFGDLGIFIYSVLAIIILFVNDFFGEYYPKYKLLKNKNIFVRYISIGLLIIYILSFGVFDNSQFIYFQF